MTAALIYLLTNTVNGKRYVGITRQGLPERLSKHWNAAKSGRPTRIAAAIRKYGRETFTAAILETVETYEMAMAREREIIAATAPEYNVTAGGEGVLGLVFTAATRAKLSAHSKGRQTFLGRKHSPESLEKMRQAAMGRKGYWAGKTRPPETVEKMRAASTGRPGFWAGKPRSAETKRKISATKRAAREAV